MKITNFNHRCATMRGFSLIEILLVVGIIAFVATMVAVDVFRDSEVARHRNAITGTRMIATAAMRFALDTGKLPSALEELQKNSGLNNWKGPYITSSQALDPWSNAYILSAFDSRLQVKSLGADGKEGGADLNADISNLD
jgi:general secretion pathway protein G